MAPPKLIQSQEIRLPLVVAGKSVLVFRLRGKLLARTFAPAAINVSSESIFCEGHDAVAGIAMPQPEALPRLTLADGTLRYVTTQYRRHYVDLRADVPGCFERQSSAARNTLRRRIRRFEEARGTQPYFREYKLPEQMPEFYALAQAISQRTGHAGKALPKGAWCGRELIEMAAQDAIRGFILFRGETPVAFNLCRVVGDYLTGD